MTPSQLRQWSLKNSQPDQWWLCLDGVTEEIPVTVSEIERLIKTGDYALAQVLPATQAETANPVWFDVTMPAALTPLPKITTASAPLPTLEASIASAQTTADGATGARIILGTILLAVFCIFYFFAPLWLSAVFLLIFFFVAWRHLLPKTPEVVLLTVGCAAIVGSIYGGYNMLTTTDLLDGGSLHSIIHRGESHEVAESVAAKSETNVAGEHTISGDNFTGFSHLDDDQRASELAGDTEAFSKFFLAGVMTKRATLFKRGETVILEDSEGLLSSKVKLRRKGEAVGYWTNREAIDR